MMKKLLTVLILLAGIYAFGQATTPEHDANTLINKLKFIGVVDIELRPIYSQEHPLAGHLLMDVTVEYDVPKDNFITISEMQANAIVIDSTISKDELITFAYSDFCDITKTGCVLKNYYKKFECGKYVNTRDNEGPRRSEIFNGGRHTKTMTFDFGTLIDLRLSNAARDRLTPDGYEYPKQFVVNMVDMNRLFKLSNSLNGKQKNESKLVLVAEGTANYNDQNGTIRLGVVNLAVIMSRKKVDYLYENPYRYEKSSSR